MGSHHLSLTALDTDADAVASAITRWMSAKGFAPCAVSRVLEPQHERGFVLVPAGRHTVVLTSDLGEFERLRHELAGHGTVLEYFLFDSDVWGYGLYVGGRPVSGFQCVDDPADPPPATNDLDALAAAFGVADQREALAAAQRGRAVYAESVASPFLARLGIAPAGDSYAYATESGPPVGGRWLTFRREGWDPVANVELGRLRFRAPPWPADKDQLDARLAAQRSRWSAFSWVVWLLFLPISLPLWLWFKWRGPPAALAGLVPEAKPPPWRQEGAEWVAHGWRVTPAPGVTAGAVHGPVTFAWAIGAGRGGLRAVPASQLDVLTQGPMGADVTVDDLTVDGRPARRATFRSEPFGGQPGSWIRRVVWVGPGSVWVADVGGHGEPDDAALTAFDATVGSLRSE